MADLETVLGNRVRVRFELDLNGTATDPTRLELYARSWWGKVLGPYIWPTGSQIVRDSAGRFRADLLPDQRGTWIYRYEAFDGSDLPLAAEEGDFSVVSDLE